MKRRLSDYKLVRLLQQRCDIGFEYTITFNYYKLINDFYLFISCFS